MCTPLCGTCCPQECASGASGGVGRGGGINGSVGRGNAGVGKDGGGGEGNRVSGRGRSRGGGLRKEALLLDYGDVYEGMLYQRRSFVIVNKATMPLEFQLSSSLPASELNFSLSAVTLKQFKSVNVEAQTRLQVGGAKQRGGRVE